MGHGAVLGKALSPRWGVRWGAHPDAWVPPGPHGQQHWPEGHPACGGRAQSPIDIRTQWAQPDPSLPPIRPVGQPGTPAFTLSNNGHTGEWVLGGVWGGSGGAPHMSQPPLRPPPCPPPQRCWHCRPPCGYRGCHAASPPLSSTSTGDGPATLAVPNTSSTGTVPPPRYRVAMRVVLGGPKGVGGS